MVRGTRKRKVSKGSSPEVASQCKVVKVTKDNLNGNKKVNKTDEAETSNVSANMKSKASKWGKSVERERSHNLSTDDIADHSF